MIAPGEPTVVVTLTPENVSSLLKTGALVALLLAGWVELGRKKTRIFGRVRGVTMLDIAQLVDNKRFNTFVNIHENTTLDDSSVIRILDVCILGDGNAVEVDEDLCLVKAMPIRNCYTQQIIRRRLQPSS
ncbi:hypothetical protein HPB52_009811 [Rhipicephalus sanguineus]|uniref:Uncharacterized protein n=1 Tax=Rhipicephalus sanguineus TaxID=34632 RepID=A0A9D4QFJ2_RHISA|nr:hypothetical protein HPB52_009811 [Rhipicephalus sanguineus]